MTVYVLSHEDARDYYRTERTDLGVYSTRDKALEALALVRAGGKLSGELFDPTRHKGQESDLWFLIMEEVVDRLPAESE
jgi:hypothetical protein